MSPKDEEEIRRLILERRARFVAAALSMSGLSACSSSSGPTVCLSFLPDASATGTGSSTAALSTARVCLSPPLPTVSTSVPVVPSASASDTTAPSATTSEPPDARVCLSAPWYPDASTDASTDASPEAGSPSASFDDGGLVEGGPTSDSAVDEGDAGVSDTGVGNADTGTPLDEDASSGS